MNFKMNVEMDTVTKLFICLVCVVFVLGVSYAVYLRMTVPLDTLNYKYAINDWPPSPENPTPYYIMNHTPLTGPNSTYDPSHPHQIDNVTIQRR